MDDLGDYIYLILLVVASLTSMLGKRKKGSGAKQRPAVSSEKSWEERMRDLSRGLGSEAEEEQAEETVVFGEPESESGPVFADAAPIFADAAPKETVLQPTPVHVKPSASKAKTMAGVEDLSPAGNECWTLADVDDARRAFVYSEIFNRRY